MSDAHDGPQGDSLTRRALLGALGGATAVAAATPVT